jgi:hypothetical protein
MSLTSYYGYLDANDLGIAFDECDAVLALCEGNYALMVECLKETPKDTKEVLDCIYDFPEGIPALYTAFPELQDTLLAELEKRLPTRPDLESLYIQCKKWRASS